MYDIIILYIIDGQKKLTQFMPTAPYMGQLLFCNFFMNKPLREQKRCGCDDRRYLV